MFRKRKPSILFFPINGSGLGHLNRCLAYARHMPESWKHSFFSLSAAVEPVLEMGYDVDYFLSPFWTSGTQTNWNRELAARLGLMLEHLRPDALVFDGTHPYLGLRRALHAYNRPIRLIWSRRGLRKDNKNIEDQADLFDLILEPGEIEGPQASPELPGAAIPLVRTAPVMLFDREELLGGIEARKRLNLPENERCILFSTGSGNLKNMEEKIFWLMQKMLEKSWQPVWLQPPISVKIPTLPDGVPILEKYPIAACLKAFAGIVSAAGYNSCYETGMAGVPALLLPNEKLLDRQKTRAGFLVEQGLAIIHETQTEESLENALDAFLSLIERKSAKPLVFPNGASQAAGAIAKLLES